MNCLYCGKVTSNPKFCSRSCAASYNNKKYPKRKPEGSCAVCGEAINSSRKYCKNCRPSIFKNTIRDLKSSGNAVTSSYTYIRTQARKRYLASDKPKQCLVCGYDLHFDVCHIKPISSFVLDTHISEVNDLSNLVALCKNHHWELDNGYLKL